MGSLPEIKVWVHSTDGDVIAVVTCILYNYYILEGSVSYKPVSSKPVTYTFKARKTSVFVLSEVIILRQKNSRLCFRRTAQVRFSFDVNRPQARNIFYFSCNKLDVVTQVLLPYCDPEKYNFENPTVFFSSYFPKKYFCVRPHEIFFVTRWCARNKALLLQWHLNPRSLDWCYTAKFSGRLIIPQASVLVPAWRNNHF